jgi:hypothetical protein
MGDTLNLLGCLMTGDQLPSQSYTATYFMVVDMAMIFQYVYYTLRSREALGLITADMRDPDNDVCYVRLDGGGDDAVSGGGVGEGARRRVPGAMIGGGGGGEREIEGRGTGGHGKSGGGGGRGADVCRDIDPPSASSDGRNGIDTRPISPYPAGPAPATWRSQRQEISSHTADQMSTAIAQVATAAATTVNPIATDAPNVPVAVALNVTPAAMTAPPRAPAAAAFPPAAPPVSATSFADVVATAAPGAAASDTTTDAVAVASAAAVSCCTLDVTVSETVVKVDEGIGREAEATAGVDGQGAVVLSVQNLPPRPRARGGRRGKGGGRGGGGGGGGRSGEVHHGKTVRGGGGGQAWGRGGGRAGAVVAATAAVLGAVAITCGGGGLLRLQLGGLSGAGDIHSGGSFFGESSRKLLEDSFRSSVPVQFRTESRPNNGGGSGRHLVDDGSRGNGNGGFLLDKGRQLSTSHAMSGGGSFSLDSDRQLSASQPISSSAGGLSLDKGRQLSTGQPTGDGDGDRATPRHMCMESLNPPWEVILGRAVGYVSSIFYLGSRLSQIYKNQTRRSCEGLSMAMFATAAMANLLYGSAILMRASSWKLVMDSVPWLLGSLGTVFLDSTILLQSRWFEKDLDEDEDEDDEDEDDEDDGDDDVEDGEEEEDDKEEEGKAAADRGDYPKP